MKNTDNNTNINGKSTQFQNAEHGTQAKSEGHSASSSGSHAPQTVHLAQLDSSETNHASASGNAPASIVLAAIGDDLPVPLVTLQSDAAQQAENQNQDEQAVQQDSEEEQQEPQNNEDNAEGEVPGENTLLSQADLESLDETAAGHPLGDSMEEAVANSFGNVDDVNDTRYDWDRDTPDDEFRYSFDQDFTPAAATSFNPVPIATDDFIGTVIRGSTCERDYSNKVEYCKGGCDLTYSQLSYNILPNDIFSSDAPNVISSITFIQGGNPVTYNAAQFNGTLITLDDGSSFTLYSDGSLFYTSPNNVNNGQLPGAPETVKIFDYVLSDSTPDSDSASVFVKIYEPPVIQIGDACVVEGEKGAENNQLAFTVTLYGELPPGYVLKVPYNTDGRTAKGGEDYEHTWDMLTFVGVEGQTTYTATIYIDVLADCINECTEYMYVYLDTSCTIINNDSCFSDTIGKGIIFDLPEKIPEQTIGGGLYGDLSTVFEAGLPSGSNPDVNAASISGNIFNNLDTAGYDISQIDISILASLNPLFVLNDSNPDAVTLTGDHFIFTIDTSNNGVGDYGSWTYELTGNVANPLEEGVNQNVLDFIKITLQPLADACGCGCNYEVGVQGVGEALNTQGNEYGGYYNSEECGGCQAPTPPSTDITLKIEIVDDAQVAKDDIVDVPVASTCCPDANPQVGQPIKGNVLDNDIPSADRIADGDNAHNGMRVISLNLGTVLPDQDNTFNTSSGGTLVIRQDGSFEYTPPPSGLKKAETITYSTVDSDGTVSSAKMIFNPDHAPVAKDDPAPAVECQTNETWSITITFKGSDAGYNNSFGYYIKDCNGELTEGKIIWSDIHDTAVDAIFTLTHADLPNVNPSDIGYFIIPNGGNLNDISNKDAVTFSKSSGHWQAYVGTTPLIGTDSNIYFDTKNLNIDNFSHMVSGDDGNYNWEDLRNGGDTDFNDIQVHIVNDFNDDNSGMIFGNLLANDCPSEDGGNHISSIEFSGKTFDMGENNFITITENDVVDSLISFVLVVDRYGNYTFDPGSNNTGETQRLEFKYTLTDADGDSSTAKFLFDVPDEKDNSNCGCEYKEKDKDKDKEDHHDKNWRDRDKNDDHRGYKDSDHRDKDKKDKDNHDKRDKNDDRNHGNDRHHDNDRYNDNKYDKNHRDEEHGRKDNKHHDDKQSGDLPHAALAMTTLKVAAAAAQDDHNAISEAHLLSGSAPNAAKLSVSGNILANDNSGDVVQITNIAGQNVNNNDLSSGFKIVSTAHGDIKVFLVDGSGHAQGDYVYTLTNASASDSDSISYSILSNNQLSSANILISIADDVPSAVSHDFIVWEQPIIKGQAEGMVVSTGNVLDGAKSGADVIPVSYTPKTAVDAISFEVTNLSNAVKHDYLAMGAIITVLSASVSKVAIAIPLNGEKSFDLQDGSEMTIGSDGHYILKQPVNGINADKAYVFTYEITDHDGSKAEADLNISVKNFDGPIANEDNLWMFESSGSHKMNVLDNDVLSNGNVTVKEISYHDIYNVVQTIQVPQYGNGAASFTTHSGAVVKIDKAGNLDYKPGTLNNGQSDIDTISYKIVESGKNPHSSIGEIKAHIFDKEADYTELTGNNGNNILDSSHLTGHVSMTGGKGKNEFKIDLGEISESNKNPSDVEITDLFKSGAQNKLTFTHVSDTDGVAGLGIGDIISSIKTVSQVSPNGDIHVSFNNGTNLSIQDPGFTMSMPTANEFIQQLQEHSIQISAQI